MKRKSAKDSGGLRSEAKKEFIENAMTLPFQGVARVGRGNTRNPGDVIAKAGLNMGRGSISIGAKIRF